MSTFTQDDLLIAQARLGAMKIFQSSAVPPDEPRIKLSRDVQVSAEFRAEFDAWLEQQFGRRRVAYVFDAQALLSFGFGAPEPVIAVNPIVWRAICD